MDLTQEILRAEASLRSALLSSDVEALDALLSPALLWVDADSTVVNKTDLMSPHVPGRLRIRVLDARPSVRAINGDVAITFVPANVAGFLDGEAFEGLFLYTRTWVQENGRWRVQTSACLPGGLGD